MSMGRHLASGKDPMNHKSYREYKRQCQRMYENDKNSLIAAIPEARLMGFEQIGIDLRSKELFREHDKRVKNILSNPKYALEKFSFIKLNAVQLPHMPPMMIEIIRQYEELQQNDDIVSGKVEDSSKMWNEMCEMMKTKWNVHHVGFTEVPREFIFKGRYILYKYALVLIEEMDLSKIAKAPYSAATGEVMRVYAHLGQSSNDLARWLRKKGIKAQPVHPLGGLVVTPPLAVKAGMGYFGHSGNLISPYFGKRQRISVVLVDKPYFEITDSTEHHWIKDYCNTCNACVKACPTQAIYAESKPYGNEIPGFGRLTTTIDYKRCFSYFEPTGGCSICLKVCAFSQGEGSYERVKKAFSEKE